MHLFHRNCFPMLVEMFNKLPKNIASNLGVKFGLNYKYQCLKDKTLYSIKEFVIIKLQCSIS